MFRGANFSSFKPLEIKTSDVSASVPTSIFLTQGVNELSTEQADFILSFDPLKEFFNEGSLVWAEDKKTFTASDVIPDNLPDLPVIEEVFHKIDSAGSSQELEVIIKGDKRKEVLEAAKKKLAEIKKASVGA